jgi:signal transduction histidine kinase/ActR/RegA family two-component response regulator
MPSTSATRDALADRTLRDVVALATMSAVWLGAEPLRIVESLAAALFTVLDADFVYVALHGDADHGELAVAQTDRYHTEPRIAAALGPDLLAWARTHDPEDVMTVPNPLGSGTLHLIVRPLAINADYGLIAAGFLQPPALDPRQQLLMNVAATQATTAIDNVRLLRSLRRYAAQQREAVEEAQAARSEAEAANRAKDEFLAMLGHELRNPLAPIQTALQLMRLRGDGSAERERTVIERQVKHLTRLVDDLLDVSRIVRGKVELKRERVNISDVVAKAIELASPLIEQRRHTLDVQVPRHGLQVDGDSLRLSQVLSNLLANAAKYTEQGGNITIIAERVANDAVVRVRDNGMGIAPEMLPRIFDLFVQERQTLDRSQGGLGLGLTIVRSLVHSHGGTVRAHSNGPGCGSEFVVSLPVSSPADRSTDQISRGPGRTSSSVAGTGDIRILVVDDNEDAADMLVEVLTAEGYHVRAAHDGPAALRVAAEFRPDVALLDIGLPVMDGYELAERLQQLPEMTGIRLFAVTGYAQEADRKRSAAAGFDGHFAKPLDVDVLGRVLRDAVGEIDRSA